MCTNFKVTDNHGNVVVGRSQEFSDFLGKNLTFRPSGHYFEQNLYNPTDVSAVEPRDEFQFAWKGKYSYAAMCVLNVPVATDGMNEKGLYIGSLNFIDSEYSTVNKPERTLAVSNFVDWVLSTCETCEDVKEGLTGDDPVIVKDSFGGKLNQHFPIHDAKGNSIVVEFIDKKVNIHDNNEFGVLTNDPAFDWQITNLRNYVAVQPFTVHQAVKGNLKKAIQNPSQGSGFSGIPGGQLPPERFVCTAIMVNYAGPVDSADEAVNLVDHILNTVDIPQGVVRSETEDEQGNKVIEQDYTQYITISDLSNLIFYVRLYDSPQLYSVKLKDLDFSALNGCTFSIPGTPLSIDITEQINPS